jgi:hypothetical protein
LFEYAFKVVDGKLQIRAGELQTPGYAAANKPLIQVERQRPWA